MLVSGPNSEPEDDNSPMATDGINETETPTAPTIDTDIDVDYPFIHDQSPLNPSIPSPDIESTILRHRSLIDIDDEDDDSDNPGEDILGDSLDDTIAVRTEDSDAEDSEDEPDIFDWDSFESNELTPEELARTGVERELAEIGMLSCDA
ncbi:hypothetical protein MIND_00554700 [Mycena indigotica]|uniref:Uncharacterized protein n=1 Tax=Mycena indigotica TaxID=2126181 RepID=A0A8H6SZF3_9AGAR|nr:uncharacterized protein MIND_00554700 [Mycena indigotica]KAF7307597.1 hypothetical protein MIND_00554700 [Mycena indigotica]